jgi:hypothetical protein
LEGVAPFRELTPTELLVFELKRPWSDAESITAFGIVNLSGAGTSEGESTFGAETAVVGKFVVLRI